MSRRPRRNHSAAFKAKVALDAIRVDRTLAEQPRGNEQELLRVQTDAEKYLLLAALNLVECVAPHRVHDLVVRIMDPGSGPELVADYLTSARRRVLRLALRLLGTLRRSTRTAADKQR